MSLYDIKNTVWLSDQVLVCRRGMKWCMPQMNVKHFHDMSMRERESTYLVRCSTILWRWYERWTTFRMCSFIIYPLWAALKERLNVMFRQIFSLWKHWWIQMTLTLLCARTGMYSTLTLLCARMYSTPCDRLWLKMTWTLFVCAYVQYSTPLVGTLIESWLKMTWILLCARVYNTPCVAWSLTLFFARMYNTMKQVPSVPIQIYSHNELSETRDLPPTVNGNGSLITIIATTSNLLS